MDVVEDRRTASTPRRIVGPIQRFMHTEAAGGLALAAAAAIALIWANVSYGTYTDVWTTSVGISIGDFDAGTTLQKLIKDGLMAIFFFVVGLEIKREVVVGELSDIRVARVPFFAALGGMLVPVGLYAVLNGDGPAADGWGIPMATDIAFAVGVLSLVSRRIPTSLAAFLLAVAVIDDIGAILVIALFYSSGLSALWLAGGAAGLGVAWLLLRMNVRLVVPYVVVAVAVWAMTARSGISPTLAGVALGLLIPIRVAGDPASAEAEARDQLSGLGDRSLPVAAALQRWLNIDRLGRHAIPLAQRLERLIHPWSAFVVLPLFALAYAGVPVDARSLTDAAGSSVTAGIVAGLVAGKIIGVAGGTWLAVRLGLGDLPAGVRSIHIVGVAALAGIGFTVSVFVASLALTDPALIEQAKIGILAASLLAGAIGASLLVLAGRGR